MPVLLRVVRFALVAATVSAVPGALAGCSKFDASLGQQQAVVSFHVGTSIAERLTIRSACAKTPAVAPQAVPDLKKYPYALEQLTYTISTASNAQVATLEQCLGKFPAVSGVIIQDSSDTGS